MTNREELDAFISKADDLISSKYVLADIKIINLLKCIASSRSIYAIFKNCLDNFDYESAKKTYLVKSQFLADDKGEFIKPKNNKELLSLVINILYDINEERIILPEFINRYFYENGSFFEGYSAFIENMIKPFKNAVVSIMEDVIKGKIEDPVEVDRKKEEEIKMAEEESLDYEKINDLSSKIKDVLFTDKKKVKEKKIKEVKKDEFILIIDMLANAVDSKDKDGINYAFLTYKYMAKRYVFSFYKNYKKLNKFIKELLNEL